MRLLFALSLLSVCAAAQELTWDGFPASITEGTAFTVNVNVSAPATGWGGLGVVFNVAGGSLTAVTVLPAITAAGGDVTCNTAFTGCILIGATAAGTNLVSLDITERQDVLQLTIMPTQASVTLSVASAQMTNPAGGIITAVPPASLTLSGAAPPPPPSGVTISSLACAPATLVGGNVSTCTVTLSGAAPASGATITLESEAPITLSANTLTLAAGATSGTFTATTPAVAANTSRNIGASYSGSSAVFALTMTPPPPANPCAVTGDASPSAIDLVTELAYGLNGVAAGTGWTLANPPANVPASMPAGWTPARIAGDVFPYEPSVAIVEQAVLGNGCLATQ